MYFVFCSIALGLRCSMQAFSSCGKQGLLFVAVASLVAEHVLHQPTVGTLQRAKGLSEHLRSDFAEEMLKHQSGFDTHKGKDEGKEMSRQRRQTA